MGDFGAVGLLQFSLLSTSLILVVIFYIAWLSFGKKDHALVWSLSFLVASLVWLIILVGEVLFVSPVLPGLVTSFLTIMVVSLGFLGHRQRVRLETNLWAILGAGIFVWLIVVWFTVFDPHAGFRQSVVPFYAFILLSWTAWIVIARSPVRTPSVWGASATILMFALTLIASAAIALQQGVQAEVRYGQLFNVLLFTALPSSFVALGLFTVLLISADMAEELKANSIMDVLTRTLNRRGIEETIRPIFAQSRRYSQPLTVVMTDIDFFKVINDDYGHVTGDNALTIFAHTIKEQLRMEDMIGRMGGEEFIIVLPNTDIEKASILIERLRNVIAGTLISANEYKFNMTASFGLTLVNDEDNNMEDAVRRADSALYQAKDLGRNRVEII